LVASAYKTLAAENVVGGAPEKRRLLRQAAIYGANAAGKSNLLLSMEALRSLVLFSADLQEGQPLPWITPFRLNPANGEAPSTFEVIFEEAGVRYHYAVAATATRVFTEWLVAYPQGRPQRWFERRYDAQKNTYDWWFGTSFKGARHQRALWQTSTRSNALFLSTAVKLNNEQLRPVFNWLTQKLIVISPGKVDFNPILSIDLLRNEPDRARMMKFLHAADIGIDRLELQETDGLPPPPPGIGPEQWQTMLPLILPVSPKKWAKVVAWHTGSDGKAVLFDIGEESDGTRKLFEFIGGWIKALDIGATLCVDEIDRSLHPHLTRLLVRLFRSDTNPNNGQLIFTTHDTTLLDPELLRRDQIWFTEKNEAHATTIYSLLDYSPRKNENLERGYLLGRYGAIPFVGDLRL
jgi:hypothetical protein